MATYGIRTDQPVTPAHLDRFATKVQRFYAGLDTEEQALFLAVLRQGTAQEDVQGYAVGFLKFELLPLPPPPPPPPRPMAPLTPSAT